MAIMISGLSKSYDGAKAISELSMKIPAGSIFGLVGPNGAGKSTLIQMIMGIIKPDDGEILVLGSDIQKTGNLIRQSIGYVPDVPCLYPSFTVEKIFSLGSRLYEKWDWDRCKELSQSFDLPLSKRIRSLSRGVKVRLATVMALAIRPQILLLDEPTAGLDPIIRKQFLQTVIDESASNGTTVFYSSHNLHDLEQTADHIAALQQGKMVFNLSMDDLKNDFHCLQVVFDDDFSSNKLAALPGIINSQCRGKLNQILIQGNIEQIEAQIHLLNPRYLEICDISLEDIFINLMKKEDYKHPHPA